MVKSWRVCSFPVRHFWNYEPLRSRLHWPEVSHIAYSWFPSVFKLLFIQLPLTHTINSLGCLLHRLIWKYIFLFQRWHCIELHIYPGGQCYLPHFRAEHHGCGHGPWWRICSRCLLGELLLHLCHIGVILGNWWLLLPSGLGYLCICMFSLYTFRKQVKTMLSVTHISLLPYSEKSSFTTFISSCQS